MRKNSKNRIVFLMSLLCVVFFIFLLNSYNFIVKQKDLFNQEKLKRLEQEEKILNLTNTNLTLKQQLEKLEQTRFQQEARFRELQEISNRQILELQNELEKVSKLKDKLEESLKEALVSPEGGE